MTRLPPLPYTGRVPGKYAAFFAFLFMLATPDAPFAHHEISHRYTDETGGSSAASPGDGTLAMIRSFTSTASRAETELQGGTTP